MIFDGFECRLLAQSGHSDGTTECPLLGAKRTLTNRCSPISIYSGRTNQVQVPGRTGGARAQGDTAPDSIFEMVDSSCAAASAPARAL
jgi:hypothetical protein